MMSFEKVINGILRYINNEIYSGMNDWQEVFARIAISRLLGNTEELKTALMNNSFFKTFGIVDANGNIDVEQLMQDLRTQIERKGSITIAIPMFGKFTFTAADVDKLHYTILEER